MVKTTLGIMKYLAKYFIRVYQANPSLQADPSLFDQVVDAALYAYSHVLITRGDAVRIATLYVLGRRGVDVAKLLFHELPRNPRKRAHVAIQLARTIAAKPKKDRDEIDRFLHVYSYVIFLASKYSMLSELPDEQLQPILEKARDILWAIRHQLPRNRPLAYAGLVLRSVMYGTPLPFRLPCAPVRVVTPSGIEAELVPRRVWTITYKLGLFEDPATGKEFRVGLPQDYPYSSCPRSLSGGEPLPTFSGGFKDPVTGEEFRSKLPRDYPNCP